MAQELIDKIKFDEHGLVPVIVQDYYTKEVLMLAYMNKESFEKTILTKETWFYSRSRKELWNKGATSGHKQYIKKMSYDCDGDTLLIEVRQIGSACHTGGKTCFFNKIIEEEEREFSVSALFHLVKVRKEL